MPISVWPQCRNSVEPMKQSTVWAYHRGCHSVHIGCKIVLPGCRAPLPSGSRAGFWGDRQLACQRKTPRGRPLGAPCHVVFKRLTCLAAQSGCASLSTRPPGERLLACSPTQQAHTLRCVLWSERAQVAMSCDCAMAIGSGRRKPGHPVRRNRIACIPLPIGSARTDGTACAATGWSRACTAHRNADTCGLLDNLFTCHIQFWPSGRGLGPAFTRTGQTPLGELHALQPLQLTHMIEHSRIRGVDIR